MNNVSLTIMLVDITLTVVILCVIMLSEVVPSHYAMPSAVMLCVVMLCHYGECCGALYLESLEIVDEDIGQPEVVDQLQVDRDHGLRGDDGVVQLGQESLRDPQSRLLPQNVEVGTGANVIKLFMSVNYGFP